MGGIETCDPGNAPRQQRDGSRGRNPRAGLKFFEVGSDTLLPERLKRPLPAGGFETILTPIEGNALVRRHKRPLPAGGIETAILSRVLRVSSFGSRGGGPQAGLKHNHETKKYNSFSRHKRPLPAGGIETCPYG